MRNTIQRIEKEFGYCVEIEKKVRMISMPKTMEKCFGQIFQYLSDNKVQCDNDTPAYARFVGIDWDDQMAKSPLKTFLELFTKKWHFFAGALSPRTLESKDTIQSRKIEKTKYITGKHYGSYTELDKTYKKLYDYAKDHNITLADECFEFYLNDPNEVPEELLETEVYIEIRK
jgi:effector-binding domain-containing protein